MQKSCATKMDVQSIAKTLKTIMGEDEVEDIARSTRFLRRKRVLIPYGLVLALLSTLGIGKADWITDILRAYNALTGFTPQHHIQCPPSSNHSRGDFRAPRWYRCPVRDGICSAGMSTRKCGTACRSRCEIGPELHDIHPTYTLV